MNKIDPRILQSLELQNEDTSLHDSNEVLLALDWGEKFCGLAWTPDGQVCLPVGVFPGTQIQNKIKEFAQEKSIKKIIIGLPISGDGSENHICKAIRNFANDFISLDVKWSNERGSSQATLSPKNERIDDLAAVRILEQYLQTPSRSAIRD